MTGNSPSKPRKSFEEEVEERIEMAFYKHSFPYEHQSALFMYCRATGFFVRVSRETFADAVFSQTLSRQASDYFDAEYCFCVHRRGVEGGPLAIEISISWLSLEKLMLVKKAIDEEMDRL